VMLRDEFTALSHARCDLSQFDSRVSPMLLILVCTIGCAINKN
jgi:hypothetical protein